MHANSSTRCRTASCRYSRLPSTRQLPPATSRRGRHSPKNLFWLAQHVAAMMAFAALPGSSCVPYGGTLDELVEEATAFVLRGIGMRDANVAITGGADAGLEAAADD